MSTGDPDIDERMERLGRATEGVGPRPGFSAKVMTAIAAERPVGVLVAARLSSRRLLPAFAIAAVLAIFAALESEDSVDEALASGYGSVEVEW